MSARMSLSPEQISKLLEMVEREGRTRIVISDQGGDESVSVTISGRLYHMDVAGNTRLLLR